MANVLKMEKRVAVLGAIAEGSSIRSVERMTGVHRDTIMRLVVRSGQQCKGLLDRLMRDLPCKRVELDEVWGFTQKKQKNVRPEDNPALVGDTWTFVSVCADSKVVPAFEIGKRDLATATAFVCDLASRMKNRIQVSTDALSAYAEAIERGFGGAIDYGQIVKSYSAPERSTPESRYSPANVIRVGKTPIVGNPDMGKVSTSYVERQNLTVRMHCRRLTRLTNAFSKKLDNFKAAMGLHFAYYNLVKIHRTIRCTPAMACGVVPSLWTMADLVEMTT